MKNKHLNIQAIILSSPTFNMCSKKLIIKQKSLEKSLIIPTCSQVSITPIIYQHFKSITCIPIILLSTSNQKLGR